MKYVTNAEKKQKEFHKWYCSGFQTSLQGPSIVTYCKICGNVTKQCMSVCEVPL